MKTIPDPDKDILDQLDRRERRAEMLTGGIALAGALLAGGLAYAALRDGLALGAQASGDGAVVVFILAGVWLFLRLSRNS